VDLYSAFIVVPHTQGAQVRITQCYLQITPYKASRGLSETAELLVQRVQDFLLMVAYSEVPSLMASFSSF